MKTCSKCKNEKEPSLEFFSPLKKAKDGLHSWCKECSASSRRVDRSVNKDRYAAVEKSRYERHGERRRELNRRWRSENRDLYRERARPRQEQMRAHYNAKRRARYAADPALVAARAAANKKWREENATSVSQSRRAKWAAATPKQRIRTYFTSAIAHSLKGNGKGGRSWQDILGYTRQELIQHLERQFVRGMNWENYGNGWHVDHIRPVASFSFLSADDEAFKQCWAITNLQPLWAVENIRKRDKITALI